MRSKPGRSPLDERQLDATFAALANSTRRAILARLTEGDAGVNELAEPFEMSLPAISKHLKVLEGAGLITRGRQAQYRPCALEPQRLDLLAAWLDSQRDAWHQRFDRMDDYLTQLQTEKEEGDSQ